HGTTVASNALLELRGARTGLITTRGFRDVLEIRRLRMPRLYDLAWEKPPTLVERRLRMEVSERINARGAVQQPLDEADVGRALDRLLAQGIEALSVCLLNAWANPVHEERVKSIVERRAPGLSLCISSEVLPEIKEYERTSTTVINTYVLPIVRRYLATLRAGLDGIAVRGPRLLTGSGYLLRVPAIDLAEVGAGGGSIVWRDAGGALQVGPRSAGASPGPLCYDLGGTEPTVTDANIVLGYLNPTALAGGAVK